MKREPISYHGRRLAQVGISWYDETGRWLGVSYAEARRSIDKLDTKLDTDATLAVSL